MAFMMLSRRRTVQVTTDVNDHLTVAFISTCIVAFCTPGTLEN